MLGTDARREDLGDGRRAGKIGGVGHADFPTRRRRLIRIYLRIHAQALRADRTVA